MTGPGRAAALGLLVTAFLLAALGQFYFLRRPDYRWDGLVFYALAALCFLLAWRIAVAHRRQRDKAPRVFPTLHAGAWLRRNRVVATLAALALLLSSVATLLVRNRAWNQSTYDVVILWLLGMGAVIVAAFWPAAGARRSFGAWLAGRRGGSREPAEGHLLWAGWRTALLHGVGRDTWLEIASVAGLTVLAFLLRAMALDSVPYTLGGDEAWQGLLARQVLSGELRNPFVMGTASMPTLFYWPLGWSLRMAGDSMVGLRLPAALAGTASVPLLYLFARSLWGRRMALLSAAFLAAYDYHIHYSRLSVNNVWDPLVALLTLWLLERGLAALSSGAGSSRSAKWFALAGLVMGFGVYFYTGARLLPLLVIFDLAFFWVQQRRTRVLTTPTRRLAQPVLWLALAFWAAAGPMLGYALGHPNEWNARLNEVGIFQSGWLAREPGLTGKPTLQILAEQFLRAAGAFNVLPDRTTWYGAMRPLLGFVAGIFAVLGMAWAAAHLRQRRYFLVFLWFWSVIIVGGMLTESPPSSQRLVLAIPAVALLVATGLEQSVRLARRLLHVDHRWADLALGLLVVALAADNVRFYFAEFTPTRRYGSENGETATMIGHYLHELDGDYTAYLFGAPRLYWGFGTMPFLAPNVRGQDVVKPLQTVPDFVDKHRASVFLFLPERAAELVWVQQAFPDGYLREFHDAWGQERFIAYEAEAEQGSVPAGNQGICSYSKPIPVARRPVPQG